MMGKMEIRSPPGSRPRDGRHCDLCGCSQPAVRCDKCGCQIFCLSCDDMYHRHPKRRFHLRKAVDPISPVPQARPVLPMKVSHLNAINPGDPSKMPLPPPRKKKSLFSSFRKPSPSAENSPPLPKKEYSWTDRLGSIKKFMSNRPLPPLPPQDDDDTDSQPVTNGQVQRGDLSFIHKRTDDRPPQLPQRSPRSPDFPGIGQEKENRIPSFPSQIPGQIRNGSLEPDANHMNQNHEFNSNEQNQWNNRMNQQNDTQAFGTLNRQRPFLPPGAPGLPGGMHQSSSATDLHNLHNAEAMHGPVPPHYPHYPMNPHMPPHYPYPVYPGYPNYPQYFGNSFANLSNPPTSEGDFSDSESSSRHSSKRHAFRKRAKRSQSVMMDRMAYPGQFFPFGPYPGYGPWGAPMPMETPPSPASSVRSLNRTGRTRRRKKGTSEDDDEELSETSSPMSRPKSSSSDPKEDPRAPLATQTTSSEDESDDNADKRRNKINTIKRQLEPIRSPSPSISNKKVAKLRKSSSKQSDSDTQESPAVRNDRRPSDSTAEQRQPVRISPIQQQSNLQRSPTPQQTTSKESSVAQSSQIQPHTTSSSATSDSWECRHCTFMNPIGNRICQVCCKTATPRTETPVSSHSRSSSSFAKNRKDSAGSENEYFVPDEKIENETSKKEKQDMASLNSALDEAEKQISKGLEELMKLKDDIDASTSNKEKSNPSDSQAKSDNEDKPVYKSSGKMRTSILDKLNLNKSQATSVSTSTETQTNQNNRTIDKIIEARRLSSSSTASETYNSPLAQSPELERGFQRASKQKRDSSCQTQQDSIAEYLEKRKAAEEAYLGRPINNFGFGFGDRMDMVTSPVPSMYDRFYGGGFGMMQRSHSRASLFTGRVNDFGPMDYGPGFGYGPTPMYRSVSRGSLTGDYPEGRMSEFHNLRKPDYYLSMEELVERRRQDNIRAQGLELVRMIREAEQQGFNADDIQVALTHCGKQNPLEWLQENWRNMVDSVLTLSTNYGNDKKENDIGLLSENEARDALRLHKGNIWAAVTECVEGRQRKYLELSARGNFSRQDIVDALTSSEGDVEMAYAKLTKSTGKPFLMRIWGQGEGVQNQDGAQPMSEDFHDRQHRYFKDETLNTEYLSDDIWSEDGDVVDWDEEEDYEEERGDIEDLRTCQEDLSVNAQDIRTPESEKSDYCDAFATDDRNVSSPSDDVFFVIPEAKPEKKKGFLSKLVALRRDSKENSITTAKEGVPPPQEPQSKEDSTSQKITSEQKNGGALNTLKSKFSAIKDTVTGGAKNDKKVASSQLERRTIIVRGQLEHESLSTTPKEESKFGPIKNSLEEYTPKPDIQNEEQIKNIENSSVKAATKSTKSDNDLTENKQISNHKNNTENESIQVDSKKTTNKNSQSLAERLKFAKQTYSSLDAPGPSGINKGYVVEAKEDVTSHSPKDISLPKQVNLNSNKIPEKETIADERNVNKIQNNQNLEKHESNKKRTSMNQQVSDTVDSEKTVSSNNNKPTEVVEVKNTLGRENQDLSKSNIKATKTDELKNKSPSTGISQTKNENNEILANKKTGIMIESQNKPVNVISSDTTIKVNDNKDNSVSRAKNDMNNEVQISKIVKQNNVAKANSSNTILSENNVSTELKVNNSQKEKSETVNTFPEKISPEVNEKNKSKSILKSKEENDNKAVEGVASKSNNEITKSLKTDNEITQQMEIKTGNSEISVEVSKEPEPRENSKNSKSADNQELEKSQNYVKEKSNVKELALTKTDSSASKNSKDSSKANDTVQSITNENQETAIIKKSIKLESDVAAEPSKKTDILSKLETGVPAEHSKKTDNISAKSEQILHNSSDSKNVTEEKLSHISKQELQNNTAHLETQSESKSNNLTNITPQDMSGLSPNVLQESLTGESRASKSKHSPEVDNGISKINDISESSSELPISNVIQNLDAVDKEIIVNDSQHTENIPQTSTKDNEATGQMKDTNTASAQNIGNVPEESHGVGETKKENKDDTSAISHENDKEVIAKCETKQLQTIEKSEDKIENVSKTNEATNFIAPNSSQSNLVPDNKDSTVHVDSSLRSKNETLPESLNEEHKIELSAIEKVPNEKETENKINYTESEIKNSQKNELKSSEENKLPTTINATENALLALSGTGENVHISAENHLEANKLPISDNILENAPLASSRTVENLPLSTENHDILLSSTTPPKSEVNDIAVKVSDNVLDQETIKTPDLSKDIHITSSDTANTKSSNNTDLQAPVFSKEFPNKNVIETPESKQLSNKVEVTAISPVSKELESSEILQTNTNISDSLKLKETPFNINASDSNKTITTSLIKDNLNNDPSTSKNAPNISEGAEKQENTTVTSKTTNIIESSLSEDKLLISKTADSSKPEQNSSEPNSATTTSTSQKSFSTPSTNDSIKDISTNASSDIPEASSSSNANISDNSKTIALLSDSIASESIKAKEIPVIEHSKSSAVVESTSIDDKSSAFKPSEQHSKVPETIAASSSESNKVIDTSSNHTEALTQNKRLLERTDSEENSTASESDDTDIEFSDNSRRGSLLLPSPVDTLRSRFEGLASGTTVRGGPVRPASPFRRMSFNSRKQVIALERKKDTSADKPWYHKVNPEPVKIVQPKRSIKQQLELERKVRKMVADRKCRTYKKAEIVVQLMDMNFEEEEAMQAANECSTLEQAISYLQQECSLCAGHFPVSLIVCMTHCEHRACRECIRAYFTVQIRDRTILDLLCPFCNEPDIGDEDVAQDYFNHLDIMLKKLVDVEIHELFQRKLRDRVLMKDPNFRWCSQCSSGFIAMPNLKRLICPDCNAVTCASCRRLWEKEHQGISCEAFAALKDATDPEAQAAGLAKLLTEDGISCPSCHFRYALAKGGCMHFRCIQCQHDFCSGCSRPFKMGQKCGVSEFCAKLGLHAHHPRNCLFYLRDKEPEDLQKLLSMNDIKYNHDPPDGMEIKTACQVMEQKETADGMIDDYCGKDVQEGYAGLCRVHYVEYLGQLVNKYKVDPIQIFDNDDLELVLRRANIRLPPKRYRENDAQYREKLIKAIQEELPLDRMDGS